MKLDTRYIYNRIRAAWFQRAHPDAPWLTADAVSILSTWLRPSDCGLEWGSGRSTAWFARRVCHLISVENDPGWFNRVERQLAGASNVDLRLTLNEAAYVGICDSIASESLDFVLVDGALARDACCHRSIGLLKPGALLILDNANWYIPCNSHSPGTRHPGDNSRFDATSWDCFLERVALWRRIWTTDGCADTAFWIKPPAQY
jgi:hypothetical protein